MPSYSIVSDKESKKEKVMRKVHYKVVLDVFICEDDEANVADRLRESTFTIYYNALDDVADIHDISVESVEVTDSR